MAIYRGPGGSGDATGDAANEAQLAQEYAANAATSATNASNSATAAASSASAASTSESNASTSASAASSSASAASTSATNASNSATAAASSASAASTSASNAAASESAAAASEAAAATSETNAAASEAAAATSETNAAASEAAAATSETNAAASEAAAATSESNAATSETNAASSASAASTSASNASTSATNAANSASAAATSESNAATSESNAATSESNAATSETNAANSASAAATSSSNASTSETNAASSASAAATSAANAAASYDSFDDRYLGTKASDPALDNDGNALVTGALYYNTTDGEMRVYDGSQWLAASAASQAILVVYSYTATAAQTTFTGADDNAVTLSYTQGSIIVTLNGVVLEDGTDYTATNGTSVVLTTGAALNDEVNIHAFTTFDVANVYTQAQSDARYLQLSGGTLTGTLNATALNTSGAVVFNDAGADVDFRVEGDTDANLLFVDAGNDRVGVGTNAPGDKFQVAGNALFGTGSSAVTIGGATATAGGATDKNLTLSAWSPTSGVNEYGGNLTLAAGRPTGNGSGVLGSVIIKVGKGGATSSTAGSVVDAITADIETLTFKTGETERMRIDSSGNVGIGVTSPAARLNLASTGNGYRALFDDTTNDNTLGVYSDATNIRHTSLNNARSSYKSYGIQSNGIIFSATNGSESARITSGGYFKASNNGTYLDVNGAYHEFNQSALAQAQLINATNGSYNSAVLEIRCARASSSDYYLIVGRSSSGADNEFYITGAGNAYADGTWNNNGADYAEFFESVNGQALTLGATVVLDGNKVREATDQDPATSIIGVVRPKEPSKASMVVGNTAWNKWANKYLTDDFDRYIMEDHDVVEWEETITDEEGNASTKQHSYESHAIPEGVTVPADATRKTHNEKGNKFQHYKLNPAWNPDSEYVNRENRAEWNIIGLLGQVKILKGQPVGDRWIKMRDVSETVEEWMIR